MVNSLSDFKNCTAVMSGKERRMIKSNIIGRVVALSLLGTGAAQSTAPTGTIQGSAIAIFRKVFVTSREFLMYCRSSE